MEKLYGIDHLRAKLRLKKPRVDLRYKFYEQKHQALDFQISTPPQLQWMHSHLGWCAKAVDSLADRLDFLQFTDDNYNLNELFQMNNPDTLKDSAILSALISSCSFVYISPDDDGFPRMQVIDGGNATGIIDPITGLLTEGYAILDCDEFHAPTLEAYFIPGETVYYEAGKAPYSIKTNCPYPLLVPIVYRPDDKRPFGHSRISRACMSYQDAAARTIKRSEIAAEFYSYPQKYVTGLAQDSEQMDKWRASMSSMMVFEVDDNGNSPSLGQFSASSMEPHLSQLKMLAALFGGETGLTMDDLGFATGNPASADAIKSAHENLRLTARKAQKCFGTGFLNVGMVAACLRDDFAYKRKSFYNTGLEWAPVFEPDGSMLSGIGDALIKINQVIPDYISEDKLRKLTGL